MTFALRTLFGVALGLAIVVALAPPASAHPVDANAHQAAAEVIGAAHGMELRAPTQAVESKPPPLPPASVPKASCGPDDLPETGLQGQVPWRDRISGRAAEGYSCNLKLIGHHEDNSFASFDSYKNCAYYSDNAGGYQVEGATVVLDVSDPRKPVETARLTARAMGNNGESLRVNQARGLLASDHYDFAGEDAETTRSLAVYDLTEDCRRPKLLADVIMPSAVGHEGCFQPDGMVYYMSSPLGGTITPIDLTDPRHPKQLSEPWALPIHGCSISDDGNRGYFGRIDVDGATGAMMVVDTSQVQARMANASPKAISRFETPDGQAQQSTIPLSYGGRPYVFDWSELKSFGTSPLSCGTPDSTTNFGYPRILDVSDEKQPSEVSKLQTEVMLPQNCSTVLGDYTAHTIGMDQGDNFWNLGSKLFLYDSHYCRTDRQHDPTLVACASFASGLRVFDIRDPRQPREVAYYNTGTASAADPTVDFAVSPPVIRRDLGQIWWVTLLKGFHVAQFRDGVWPFKDADPCPGSYDYAADQYDLEYRACLVRREQTPAPAADAVVALPSNRRCRRSRRFGLRLGNPATGAITRARVYVNGKRVRDLRGKRIPAAIGLRTPRRGRYTVRVVIETTTGETIRQARRYRACTPTARR